MSIFFRHLFTSIRRRPMQPILLILVIALSVAVCITAFHTRIFLREESNLAIEAKNGIADFSVTFSSDSETRFLFEGDIIKAMKDDDAVVCGAFTVPLYYGENKDFYYGIATDFNTVSTIFDMSFVEYEQFHKNQVTTIVFVSRRFAEATKTKIGDKITLSMMEKEKEFIVAGISKNDLLGEYSVMIDIKTLVGTIAENSLFVSLLGDDFIPSTKIYVSTDNDVDAAIANINDAYEDVIVTKITQDAVLESTTRAIVLLIIMLAIFFAFAVIYVCFAVLTAQRQSENSLFFAAGAKAYMLNALSIAEMFFYWLIGGLIGIGLSYPISEMFIFIGDFYYCTAHIEAWTIFASLGITLLAAEGSMCLFILVDSIHKKKAKKIAAENKALAIQAMADALLEKDVELSQDNQSNNKRTGKTQNTKSVSDNANSIKWVVIVIAALTLVFTGLSIIENEMIKKVFGIEAIFSLMVVVFIGTKYLFPKVTNAISKLKKLPVTFRYAVKNASKVESLANTASVVALLFVILGAIGVMLSYAIKSVEHDTNYLAGEYMVQNITESSLDELRTSDDIEAIYGVYLDYGTGLKENYRYTIISTSDVKGFAPHLDIEKLPTGNNAFMCKEIAMASKLNIGDEFVMTISGIDYKFVYSGNVKLGGSTIVINYEDMGLNPTFYEVVGKNGMSGEEVKQSIVSILTFDSAVVVPATQVTLRFVETAERYTTCIEFIALFLFIFSMIGIVDSIISSYRSRKDEFVCFTSAGMSNKKLKKLKANEIAFAIAFAIIIAVISFFLEFGIIHQIIRSFTENMFYVF